MLRYIIIFSTSASHFGETGGAFFALYGIAPRASAVYGTRSLQPGGRFFALSSAQPSSSLYSLCTVRSSAGPMLRYILIFSSSASHFGETGGAFLRYMYMESPPAPPGLLSNTAGAWALGGVFSRYMASASVPPRR